MAVNTETPSHWRIQYVHLLICRYSFPGAFLFHRSDSQFLIRRSAQSSQWNADFSRNERERERERCCVCYETIFWQENWNETLGKITDANKDKNPTLLLWTVPCYNKFIVQHVNQFPVQRRNIYLSRKQNSEADTLSQYKWSKKEDSRRLFNEDFVNYNLQLGNSIMKYDLGGIWKNRGK